MAKVEIYSTQSCPSCIRAKQLLQTKNVEFIEHKVDEDKEKFVEMKTRTEGSRTVPAIFINDEFIGGFDRLFELEKAGELDKKLL